MISPPAVFTGTFADNTETLGAALEEFGSFAQDVDALLSGNSTEIDRLLANLAQVTDTVHKKLPELDRFLSQFGDAAAAVFRAGNRGEFLNQKILCIALGPPASSQAGCPTGDPVVGLSTSAAVSAPTTGSSAIRSLLTRGIG